MKTAIQTTVACLAIASVTIAAPYTKRLTLGRIAELTVPSEAPKPTHYKVMISDVDVPEPAAQPVAPGAGAKKQPESKSRQPAGITFPADKPAVLELIREFRFPTQFSPPKVAADNRALAMPPFPAAFETVNTGWTIRLSAKQHDNLVALSGAVDYVTADFVPGDYGPLSGPIFGEDGKLISPNKYHLPKVQRTTTHFHLFAIPGQPYEVVFHRGEKSEKHTITVTTE
jgi:hypothetical protein